MSGLASRLEDVRARVARAAERSGRAPTDVHIVAVSKAVPTEAVAEAYGLGQREFGENRVQELRDKKPALLREVATGCTWHMLGHLQSNKVRLALGLFDIIESLDSADLAGLVDRQATALGRRVPVLLEVDFSGVPQRSGFDPGYLEAGLERVSGLAGLEVRGLMTVAPLGLDERGQRVVFRQLASLRARLSSRYPEPRLEHLSMGMSDDFEIAIEEGATIVRIGRAIFGERPPQ